MSFFQMLNNGMNNAWMDEDSLLYTGNNYELVGIYNLLHIKQLRKQRRYLRFDDGVGIKGCVL